MSHFWMIIGLIAGIVLAGSPIAQSMYERDLDLIKFFHPQIIAGLLIAGAAVMTLTGVVQ